MKYFYLAICVVYLPLTAMYLYQRKNIDYRRFGWGRKNRLGVWLAMLFAFVVLTAKPLFPSFVDAIEIGWEDYRGRDGGEFYFFAQWLIALTLLIFPHLVKKDNWSKNPSPSQYHNRFNANAYWYTGLIFSLLPIYNTWHLLS